MNTRKEMLNQMINLCQKQHYVADIPKEYMGYLLSAMQEYATQEIVKHLEIASKDAELKESIKNSSIYDIIDEESITGIKIYLT